MDRSLIQLAFNIASEAHATQNRKNGVPYIKHPFDVFWTLKTHFEQSSIYTPLMQDAKYEEKINHTLCAALLHDVKEDCDPSFWDRIVKEMPQEVINYVLAVTDPDRSFGNRKARKEKSIQQRVQYCETVAISLADSKSNLIDIPGVENKFLFEAYMPEKNYAIKRFYSDRINKCAEERKANYLCPFCEVSDQLAIEADKIMESYYNDPLLNTDKFIRGTTYFKEK